MGAKKFDSVMVFGEVLFDVFPDGKRVIGGAPFNVACHLKAMGLDPVFISRIGKDDPGREVVRVMDARSLSIAGLQRDEDRMTGVVRVSIENDEPSYEIKNNVAYDHIEFPQEELINPEAAKLFYHGTLAARNPVSRENLSRLARMKNNSVFCDINLRDPWWQKDLVSEILSWCSYLKVNEHELDMVCNMEGIQGTNGLRSRAGVLANRYGFECVIVTLGSRGAMLFPRDHDYLFAPSPEVTEFQDSVGAGDAFSSVFLLGITLGWDWKTILKRAVEFAATICTNKGAVPEGLDFYQETLQGWEV